MSSLYVGGFIKMVADLQIFKCLHLFSLTSYGLITGLADFPFTERCYWYLQSALNLSLKAAPLFVKKPDFPDFLILFFVTVLSEPRVIFFTVLQCLGWGCATAVSKEERRHFLLMNLWLWQHVALWFDAI